MMTSDELIESIVASVDERDVRQRHFLRESLRNLVRFAKAEQRVELQMSLPQFSDVPERGMRH